MNTKKSSLFKAGAFLVAVAALAACGGGGSTSSGGGGVLPPGGGATAVPNPSPTATATAPGTTGTTASGRVLDLDSGTPIAGATVVIGNTPIVAASAPSTLPGDDKSATTAADGTFVVSGLNVGTRTYTCGGSATGDGYCAGTTVSNAAFVHVFTLDHIALHGYVKIVASANAIGDLKVTKPTSADLTRLAKLNQYRATTGGPAAVLDEYLVEAARFYTTWSNTATASQMPVEGEDLDQGTSGPNYSPNSRYHARGGFLPNQDWENIGGGVCNGAPVTTPEDDFFAEGSTGGHYQNMMNPQNVLVGLALAPPIGSNNCQGGEEDFSTAPQ
jgi:Cysteine-rich secretory protein family